MTLAASIPPQLSYTEVEILNGASLSDIANLGGTSMVGYILPAGWEGDTITFETGKNADSTQRVDDSTGAEITHTVAAGRSVKVEPSDFAFTQFLKFRSGTSGAPVNQTGNRIITIVSRVL